jgi:hypothetical protein
MSIYWYKIGELISLSDLEKVNKKLKEQKLSVLEFHQDLLTDRYWLSRSEFGSKGILIVEDYSKKDESFSRMTSYGLAGGNKAGLVLDALVSIGGLTIASEYDELSPFYKAQTSDIDHNKLKHSTKEDRIKAGITKH